MSNLYVYVFVICLILTSCTNKEKEYSFSFSDNYNEAIIPARFDNGRVYIPVSVVKNDIISDNLEKCTYYFLFDTGTSEMVIDSVLNENDCFSIKYDNSFFRRIHAPAGVTYSYPSFINDRSPLKIQIGSSFFDISECEIMDYAGRRNGILPAIQLGTKSIININLFQKYVALLSIIQNKSDSLSFVIDPYTSAPCIEDTIFVNNDDSLIAINGKFIMDIGMARGLTLSEEAKIKFPSLCCQDVVYRTANKGNDIVKFQQTPTVKVHLKNISANVNIDFSRQMPPGITGVIGNAFLERINFAIDYQKLQLHYDVIPELYFPYRSESNSVKKWGVIIANIKMEVNDKMDYSLQVVQLIKGHKADLAGVELNDQIIEIDSKKVGVNLNDSLLMEKVRNAENVTIRKSNGTLIILE